MAYLRFSRDKRGYENTFVVHSERRKGKSRSRILYWFRTPPGVKVGRSALDEDAIRRIEESNPSVEFDWTQILKSQAPPAPPPPEARAGRAARQGRPQRDARPPAGERPAAPRRTREGESPIPSARNDAPSPIELPPTEPSDAAELDHSMVVSVTDEAFPEVETLSPIEVAGADADEVEAEPVEIGGVRDEPLALGPGPDITGDAPPTPAHARLGAEGVLRLRARHAEVLARISERIVDPVRREELKLQAERLNPDTWVTDAEVMAGIEQYETVFEALRSVVGRRRKRRRRKGPRPPAASAETAATAPADAEDAEHDNDDADGPDSPAADDSDEG